MAVNLRKKYSGNTEVSKKNRPYRYQLDFYHGGKRIRETICFRFSTFNRFLNREEVR